MGADAWPGSGSWQERRGPHPRKEGRVTLGGEAMLRPTRQQENERKEANKGRRWHIPAGQANPPRQSPQGLRLGAERWPQR